MAKLTTTNRRGRLGHSVSSSKDISKESVGGRKDRELGPGQLALCKAEAEKAVL